jgi:hypothetical protein
MVNLPVFDVAVQLRASPAPGRLQISRATHREIGQAMYELDGE